METISNMTIDIQSGIRAVLHRKKKVFQQHVNRISGMDDPCLRSLYYARHDWDKASAIDDGLQGIFETGNVLEPVIERIVSEVGLESTPQWRIVGTQTSTNDNLLKEYQISGTIDGFLQIKDPERIKDNNSGWVTLGVVDIKTMSPNIYPRINDFESLGRFPWTRRYRGQLMLYALAHNLEMCYLLLDNKQNLFEMKLISFPVDMAYCDNLLEKAKIVNEAIETETPPVGISDPDTCPKCKFFSFCCPDIVTGKDLQVIDNDELAAVLDRMAELEPVEKEYCELEKQRDALLIKGQDVACGNWLVIWKKIIKNFGASPAKEAFTREEWRKSITRT